ncbi:hypothetical protein B0T18DRAFT_463204 [Schizothecium vesticola]|uniref:Uncharacterized protein n=1 Tax=Schizothecium vesticola TaxID=314040 RepID=A0AA40K9C1_9PEZI|nr:hypothetical protein B0T18DRAFT_463204 [Schizothecium vesticola]
MAISTQATPLARFPSSTLMASNLKNLLSYQDISKWQQSNRYLLSGYRAPSGPALASLASALHLNNETINIHSHLAGGFVFALLPIHFHLAFDPPLADAIVVTIFLEGVATCFLLSALFHIFDNHSPSVSSFFHHLDHLGIVILIHMPFLWMAGMAVANLMGALIFATRIPERWFPRKFDLLGCSHQIFHIAVLVVACLHFVTLVKASTSTRNETCVR